MNNKSVMHLAQYSAPYMGNFISSLIELENQLKVDHNSMVYVFPEDCKKNNWIGNFQKTHKVYFTDSHLSGKFIISKQVVKQIQEICSKENVDIIHTHFDGYDIPAVMASEVNEKIQVVWHYHNSREYRSNFAKKMYQKLMFYRHYKIYGKKAWLISVSDYYLRDVHGFGFPINKSTYIPNGIDLKRIDYQCTIHDAEIHGNTFLVFGGRGNDKGIDILLDAMELVAEQCVKFSIVLVKGRDTLEFVHKKFGATIPSYLQIVEPVEDINNLFANADYFISCSRRETFSYAVAEAIAYGMPVICSDIPGTKWVNHLPSVLNFDIGNSNDFVEKIIKLMVTDKNDIRKQCQYSREFIINNYTIEKWAKKNILFYDTMIR